MKRIYLDHNATTPVDPEVLDAMLPYFKELYGNPSSIHIFGQEAKRGMEHSREQIASLINADTSEIVFTSGGTESDNLAIKGTLSSGHARGKHIITVNTEHHAILNQANYLEQQGYKITFLPVDKHGIISLKQLKESITEETAIISVMLANNETGTLQPITEIGEIINNICAGSKSSRKIFFHTDAVQAAGKIPIDVKKLNVDLLSLSAHKIYGPKGIGILYVRKGTKIHPIIHGGHHERNRRAGTENIPGIIGMGKAAELAVKNLISENRQLRKLRNKLWNELSKHIPYIYLNGPELKPESASSVEEKRLPNTINISFEYIEGESILLNLDLIGIAVSTGSACTSGSLEPSHVLSAMEIGPVRSQGSLRFSLGKDNTEQEIDYVINELPGIISKLRIMSPLFEQYKQNKKE